MSPNQDAVSLYDGRNHMDCLVTANNLKLQYGLVRLRTVRAKEDKNTLSSAVMKQSMCWQ